MPLDYILRLRILYTAYYVSVTSVKFINTILFAMGKGWYFFAESVTIGMDFYNGG